MFPSVPWISGLRFPTGVAAADDGRLFITESGLDPDGRPGVGRVLAIGPDGDSSALAGDLRAPVTGLCLHDGALYVSEGGRPGRISRIDPLSGHRTTLVDGLPGGGDYHTNAPLIANDRLYFGQGAATNSGLACWDSVTMPWVQAKDVPHDLPGMDVRLAPVKSGNRAFSPYGRANGEGTTIPATLPCTSGVMRCRLDGSCLELVAWGLRNPFGLGRASDGRLLVIDLGMNDRGPRPVRETQSCLFALSPGRWYGWPDFVGAEPVTAPKFRSTRPGAAAPEFLLANHDELGEPVEPLLRFPPHSGPTHMVTEPEGTLLISLFGDKRPVTGAPGRRSGRTIVRADLATGRLFDLDVPALRRPIALAWGPGGDLLALDFGAYEIDRRGRVIPERASGCLWRIPSAQVSSTLERAEAVS